MTIVSPDARRARAALADRELCRRRLLHFTQRFRPRYLAGWVHKVICHELEKFSSAVEAQQSPRLMLLMPPRHGKSTLASEMFPAWHLGRFPNHEVIAASYNITLPTMFSRRVRSLLREPLYQKIFVDTQLDQESQSTEAWLTTASGSYVAAGVSGGISGKGAHCVHCACNVTTKRGIIAASEIRVGDIVRGYDHRSGSEVWTTVRAVSASTGKPFIWVGPTRVTPDHQIWIRASGYKQADKLSPADLRALLHTVPTERERASAQSASEPEIESFLFASLRQIREVHREHLHLPALLGAEVANSRYLQALLCFRAGEKNNPRVLHMREGIRTGLVRTRKKSISPYGGHPPHLLLARVLSASSEAGGRAYRTLQKVCVSLARLSKKILRSGVFLRPEYERRHGLATICSGLGASSSGGSVARQSNLQAVPSTWAGSGGAPHRSQRYEQRSGELDNTVPEMPHQLSSADPGVSAAYLCRGLSGDRGNYAVDLQTDTENFFCDGILVHNCLIIDDPVKDAKEADSLTIRDDLWSWYGSTAYTRLAPGGGVLWIQTWWNEDDGAGRIQQLMQEDPDSDQFKIVKFPAVAEEDEYLDADYNIYRLSEGDIPEGAYQVRSKGEPLHSERYTIEMLRKIEKTLSKRHWSALYQQNPTPEDGLYFTKDQFLPTLDLPGNKPRARGYLYQCFDFAITDKTRSDFTVGATVEQDFEDQVEVRDIVRGKWTDGDTLVEKMLDSYEKWTPDKMGVEDGHIWKTMSATFWKRARERNLFPNLVVLKTKGNDKGVRATPLQVLMQRGRLRWPKNAPWYDVAERELLRFMAGGNHDDIVDALAWCAQMIADAAPPPVPRALKKKSWRDSLPSFVRGTSTTHMSA